jgi:hypothetical protein
MLHYAVNASILFHLVIQTPKVQNVTMCGECGCMVSLGHNIINANLECYNVHRVRLYCATGSVI